MKEIFDLLTFVIQNRFKHDVLFKIYELKCLCSKL